MPRKTDAGVPGRSSPFSDRTLASRKALFSLCYNSAECSRAARIFPLPMRRRPIHCPRFRCPTRPHSRTAASRPPRWASAGRVWGSSLGSFPFCVLSDLCGVPLRATTIGAFPVNTAESGRNAERGRADARAPRTQNGGCQSFPSALAAPCAPRWLRPCRSVLQLFRSPARREDRSVVPAASGPPGELLSRPGSSSRRDAAGN